MNVRKRVMSVLMVTSIAALSVCAQENATEVAGRRLPETPPPIPAVPPGSGAADFKRIELFGGFSHVRNSFGGIPRLLTGTLPNPATPPLLRPISSVLSVLNDRLGKREGFNGFNLSATVNLSRYVGAKFDFARHFNSRQIFLGGFPGGGEFEVRERLTTFLAGIQLKDNATDTGKRTRPFAHLLVGRGRATNETDPAVYYSAIVKATGSQGVFFASRNCPESLNCTSNGFAAAIGGGLDVSLNHRIGLRLAQFDYTPVRVNGHTRNGLRFSSGIVF